MPTFWKGNPLHWSTTCAGPTQEQTLQEPERFLQPSLQYTILAFGGTRKHDVTFLWSQSLYSEKGRQASCQCKSEGVTSSLNKVWSQLVLSTGGNKLKSFWIYFSKILIFKDRTAAHCQRPGTRYPDLTPWAMKRKKNFHSSISSSKLEWNTCRDFRFQHCSPMAQKFAHETISLK